MALFTLEKSINKFFESKIIKKLENNNILFLVITLISYFFTFYFSNGLSNNQALGPHTFCIFIPFVFYSLFLIFERKLNVFKFLIYLVFTLSPLYKYFFNEIFHLEGDDSTFYTLSAEYMINNQTLRSNYSEEALIDLQPGIAYLLALEMLLFGAQNRLMQIFNISVFFISIYYLLYQIKERNNFNKTLFILILLLIPYSIKNILYTYSEWFVVFLFILSLISFNRQNLILPIILIALIPFVRQNLILVCILIFITFLIIRKDSIGPAKFFFCIFFFIGILMLPLYHNVYYAGELVFFAKQKPYNIDTAKSLLDLINPYFIFNNFNDYLNLLFLQIERIFLFDGRKLTNIIISLFVPVFFVINILNIVIIKSSIYKILYFLIFISAFAPTILLGSLAPPRFEFVNLFFIYFYFILITTSKFKIND